MTQILLVISSVYVLQDFRIFQAPIVFYHKLLYSVLDAISDNLYSVSSIGSAESRINVFYLGSCSFLCGVPSVKTDWLSLA